VILPDFGLRGGNIEPGAAVACLLLHQCQIGDIPGFVLLLSQIQGSGIRVDDQLKPLEELLGGLRRIERVFDLRDQFKDFIGNAESRSLQLIFRNSLFERNHEDA